MKKRSFFRRWGNNCIKLTTNIVSYASNEISNVIYGDKENDQKAELINQNLKNEKLEEEFNKEIVSNQNIRNILETTIVPENQLALIPIKERDNFENIKITLTSEIKENNIINFSFNEPKQIPNYREVNKEETSKDGEGSSMTNNEGNDNTIINNEENDNSNDEEEESIIQNIQEAIVHQGHDLPTMVKFMEQDDSIKEARSRALEQRIAKQEEEKQEQAELIARLKEEKRKLEEKNNGLQNDDIKVSGTAVVVSIVAGVVAIGAAIFGAPVLATVAVVTAVVAPIAKSAWNKVKGWFGW
ncbi:hypothetical protein Mgra_00008112 [Meloidogyne graminicola]|uniref:Uncharacterized protein n=1 Tax=Meloidogyne graminicola TaxID=189291 RepID=A0A8S9ZGV4_9BILA|nr:hypothetical protein Mgra_00008112 [Meloidogyne graminicola]